MKKVDFKPRQRAIILIAVVVAILSFGYYALDIISEETHATMLKHKLVRETTGTVRAKEHVRFDENNYSYWKNEDSGYQVERRPGDEEWRIYYEIDNFDQVAEPARGELLNAEMARVANSNLRFDSVDRADYEALAEGNKILVGWKWISSKRIEIIYVMKPLHTMTTSDEASK